MVWLRSDRMFKTNRQPPKHLVAIDFVVVWMCSTGMIAHVINMLQSLVVNIRYQPNSATSLQ
ncbi:hypothetical protein DV708_16005 [Aeromonas veronii]|uniref:Uncharacterized protein n=1 Tax=Aeromonas veronii TaxID=654 RepID=A0A2T4N855_AERVE|nr:hypothetical protein DAA48_00625 [Aeromonas veronii]RDE61282.1 hypothetical protein DV708_16005 [Aeromonas veronii]